MGRRSRTPGAGTPARARVPRVDDVLADPRVAGQVHRLGRDLVRHEVHRAQEDAALGRLGPDEVVPAVLGRLPSLATTMTPVLNATGVVLHTNLGRAPLSEAALAAVAAVGGYADVELDRSSGRRARRGRGTLAALLAAVPAAPDALVLNNGAAALVLATTALAAGREVVVSRGELVEIGDGFRLPDLVASTGARLCEVGTTNRTHLADYRNAVGPETGCLLKVHPGNFRQTGFTASVGVSDLAALGPPVVVDIGSGLLRPDPLLPDEPDAATALAAGAAVVTCSGDKLLGGPQAGLVLGRADVLAQLRRHPLARALRVDKLTLAALEATLTGPTPPSWAFLRADPATLRARARAVADVVRRAHPEADVAVLPSEGAVGGGSAPGLALPGWAVSLPARAAVGLREGDPSVLTRVESGRCLADLRCLTPDEDARLAAAVIATLGAPG